MPGNDDEFVIDPVIKEFEDRGIVFILSTKSSKLKGMKL
jgi:hypothetical protein